MGRPIFAGIEYNRSNSRVFGFSVFDNSFGDFSQYLYLGKSYYPLRSYQGFRINLTVGITHGYKGEHKDISPIRWGDAWAFGIIPGLGYQVDRVGVDVALLGNCYCFSAIISDSDRQPNVAIAPQTARLLGWR